MVATGSGHIGSGFVPPVAILCPLLRINSTNTTINLRRLRSLSSLSSFISCDLFIFLSSKGCDDSTVASENSYYISENYQADSEDEVSLKKGQLVEIIDIPVHSPRWKVRLVTWDSDSQTKEGWVPMNVLHRQETPRKRRNSDGEGSLCSSEGKV